VELNKMPAARSVLIVGAGIGGVSLANALRSSNIDAHMIDLYGESLGVDVELNSNAVRVLDTLGLADECLAVGFAYDNILSCDHEGNVVADVPLPKAAPPRFPAAIALSRPRLAEALRTRALKLGATLRTGVTVASLHDGVDGIQVELTDGTTHQYDLVVGADGERSQTREMLFGPIERDFINLGAWRITTKRDPEITTHVQYYCGQLKLLAVPFDDDTMCFGIVEPRPADDWISDESAPGLVLDLLKSFTAPAIDWLRKAIQDGSANINYRPLGSHILPRPWHVGRVVLLGDAAHGMYPQIGSGAGMALEDAVVLADVLERHESLDTALEEYMDRRYDRCKYVVDQSVLRARHELEGSDPALSHKILADTFSELTKPI
jgi:2-polyprenyl-6-methoxyphenol hydroxylase-like FAD-dependent oxidoreductase